MEMPIISIFLLELGGWYHAMVKATRSDDGRWYRTDCIIFDDGGYML